MSADVAASSAAAGDDKPASKVSKYSGSTQRSDAVPTVLELHGYRVSKSVGQGSYATVKLALSHRHKCHVAIKIISKKRAPQDYLDKFLPREIEVVKLLRHPNLVVFLQSIETNNRVYLVMEFASGGDLLDAVRTHKRIKEQQAGIWFGQLLDGIDYCHSIGVVHRDLKCENILLDEYKNIKVTDFGFAREEMQPCEDGTQILSETYCGSYAYAPPEILTGTRYVPQLADVWSMGVILYVMIVGRLPFDDSSHKRLLKQVNHGPVFPESRPISRRSRDLISKILTKHSRRLSIAEIRKQAWYKEFCSFERPQACQCANETSSIVSSSNKEKSPTKHVSKSMSDINKKKDSTIKTASSVTQATTKATRE